MTKDATRKRALTIALLAGALGAGLLHLYLRRYELEVSGGAPVQVLSLAADVHVGDVITPDLLDTRAIPAQFVDERHIRATDQERVLGTHVTLAVAAGEALLWTDLDVMPQGRTLSGLVREGQRAVFLQGRAMDFQGLLRPGDRVDVLWTQDSLRGSGTTRTLLQNVLVLTVGRDMGEPFEAPGKKRRSAGAGVTLSLTADQAQRLAHAQRTGKLRLSLRNPQDLQITEDLPSTRDAHLTQLPTAGREG